MITPEMSDSDAQKELLELQKPPMVIDERTCARRRELMRLAHPSNAVIFAAELAKQFRHDNEWCQNGQNKGNCLLAADELARYLESHFIHMTSVQFGTYKGKDHAWLEVWDKQTDTYIIIDPTADQFGDDIPEIVVGHISDLYQYQHESTSQYKQHVKV
jgi:hypothetical protein